MLKNTVVLPCPGCGVMPYNHENRINSDDNEHCHFTYAEDDGHWYGDLLKVIGDVDTSEAAGYCNQPSSMMNNANGKWYWEWEDEIAKPALEKLGFANINWTTGDGDSFGPLTRVVHATKDGIRYHLVYG